MWQGQEKERTEPEPWVQESERRGLSRCLLLVSLILAALILSWNISFPSSAESDAEYVLPCGVPVGIYLETEGVMVVNTETLTDTMGMERCPAENILQSGDYILAVNNQAVRSKEELVRTLQENGTEAVKCTYFRDQKVLSSRIEPMLTDQKDYKLGIWVRDDTHGIGTMTYLEKDGDFGALGHGISDSDTGEVMDARGGQLYRTDIYAITKGEAGVPGSLTGAIDYGLSNLIGTIRENTEHGVFGRVNDAFYQNMKGDFYRDCSDWSQMWEQYAVPVASRDEVSTGGAQVLTGVSGELEPYDIEIEKLYDDGESGKSMLIRVTDERLLDLTGGIVQGMSGSPILQDGKLVGAVTHVFVDDPTKGYGVMAETMQQEEKS